MRHRSKTVKLQRDKPHREALLRNLSASLIEHGQIRTTLAKAKALHSRRRALSLLGSNQLSQRSVKVLFDTLAPANADRPGGYCRIIKLGQRRSDSAPMALIEWVDSGAVVSAAEELEAAS